jgi:hypothetical protein
MTPACTPMSRNGLDYNSLYKLSHGKEFTTLLPVCVRFNLFCLSPSRLSKFSYSWYVQLNACSFPLWVSLSATLLWCVFMQTAFLEVVIPPDIIYEETSGDLMVPEGGSAKLVCKARGFPKPRVVWRREDGGEIILRGGPSTKTRGQYTFTHTL